RKHIRPSAQGAQVPPPQSMSVSLPFFIPSPQLPGLHTLAAQAPLAQSLPATHAWPPMHFGQVLPPQSTSVSSPFFALSVQDGAAQVPPLHTLSLQSAALPHALPTSQGAHEPPQSTSLSSPSLIALVQSGFGVRSGASARSPPPPPPVAM